MISYCSGYDSSFMSNIQKLFTERIEVFSSVDFSKISIVTGIIKITLKASKLLTNYLTNNTLLYFSEHNCYLLAFKLFRSVSMLLSAVTKHNIGIKEQLRLGFVCMSC